MKTFSILATGCLIVSLISTSCQKEKNAVDFEFSQTLCSDPWDNGDQADQELANSIRKYLNGQKIKVFNVEIDHTNNLAIVCEACHCLSGTKIIVSADENKSSEMESMGFVKQ